MSVRPIAVNLGDQIAEQTRQVERQFISASWLDPIAGSNAGFDAGLRGEHFAYSEHSAIYCYVCKCAERRAGQLLKGMEKAKGGRPPKKTPDIVSGVPSLSDLGVTEKQSSRWQLMAEHPSIPECVAALVAIGEPLNAHDDNAEYELYELVLSYRQSEGTLPDLAYRMVHQHTERKEFANATDVINTILSRVRDQCGNDRVISPVEQRRIDNERKVRLRFAV